MATSSLATIKNWFKTGLKPTQAQFWATWSSFWHKDEGKLVKTITQDENGTTITTTDGNGTDGATMIPTYTEPASFEIDKINGLQGALDGKVDTEVGKRLSTEDFTVELKNKLVGLNNYVAPTSQSISYIDGLQDILDGINDEIAIINTSISGLAQIQFLYFRGYRLYKKAGNSENYPQAGDELMGRGDGSFENGENIHSEVINPMIDPYVPSDTDINTFISFP